MQSVSVLPNNSTGAVLPPSPKTVAAVAANQYARLHSERAQRQQPREIEMPLMSLSPSSSSSAATLLSPSVLNINAGGQLVRLLLLLTFASRLTVQLSASSTQQQRGGDEICETLPSEIHLIKEEYDELGRLQRTCNGEVQVNKCEGMCNSQVQPSVITPTGFLKECYCCRETFLRERLVTLTHCYDPDGGRLSAPEAATMDIRLKEPAECRCFKCGDFSR